MEFKNIINDYEVCISNEKITDYYIRSFKT